MRANWKTVAWVLVPLSALSILGGCDLVINVGTYCTAGVDPGCGASETGGTGGATTTSTGGDTGGVTGGGGTTGGAGGQGGTTSSTSSSGGASECTNGSTQECYFGPDGTMGIGICKSGTQSCQPNGSWGPCNGQVLPDVETCATTMDEDCDTSECAYWSTIFGDQSDQLPLGVAIDSMGEVILLGAFKGSIQVGADSLTAAGSGTRDLFLVKFASNGDYLWGHRYGDAADQWRASLTLDKDDNIILAGTFAGSLDFGGKVLTAAGAGTDLFVAKLTPSGSLAWSERYGDASDQTADDVAVDSNGDVRVIGEFAGSVSFFTSITAMNGTDVYVARFSGSNGLPKAQMRFDDKTAQTGTLNLTTGPNGTWAITGYHGTGAVIGGATLSGNGSFVARYDAMDTPLWGVHTAVNTPSGLVSTAAGDVILSGDFFNTLSIGGTMLNSAGMSDLVIASFKAADGSVQWAKPFGGAGSDQAARLVIDVNDRLTFAMTTEDSIDFGGGTLQGKGQSDLFVVALNPDGTHRWSRIFGDATFQMVPCIGAASDGSSLAVAIETSGTITFGAGELPSNGNDVALAKLAP